jgi:hypothetical protein
LAWELLKAVMGIGIVFYTNDWFGTRSISPVIPYLVMGYLVCSVLVTARLIQQQQREDAQSASLSV